MDDTALLPLDLSTLRIVSALLGALAFILIYFGVYRVTKAPYAKWWSILLLVQGLGAGAYLIDTEATRAFSGPVGNMFGGLGAGLALVAARSIRGQLTQWWVYVVPAVFVGVASFIEGATGDAWPGGGVVPVFMFVMMTLLSREFLALVRQRREPHTSAARREVRFAAMAMSVLATFLAVFYLVRSVVYFSLGPSSDVFRGFVGPIPTSLGSCLMVLVVVYGVSELSRVEAAQLWRVRADQDDLTSLLNRNAFRTEAERLLSKPERESVALMILDFDRFKELNDTRGHDMGDRVLTAFAQGCREHLEPGDRAGRWGGDEFVVVLTGATEKRIGEVYAALNRAVMAVSRRADDNVTLSAGAAYAHPDDALDSLMARADAALYEAKRGGRSQLVYSDAASSQN